MKKILISILIVLLLILSYFALAKGMNLLKIKSINSIKEASNNLDEKFDKANELSSKTYPAEVEGLEDAIKKLKISKQQYENKSSVSKEKNPIGSVEIKTYKIHYLWTILGNYRKNRGVKSLNLDLISTQSEDIYNLQFTLMGSYTSITDFLYDIENDEELNFEIKNFDISSEISSNNAQTTNANNSNDENNANNDNDATDANDGNSSNDDNTNTTVNSENTNSTTSSDKSNENVLKTNTRSDGITLQAKFTVENIGITLD